MRIKRSFLAVCIAAALALTACTPSDDDASAESPSAEETTSADAGADAEQPEMPELPEADLEGVPDVVAQVNGEDISKEEFTTTYEGQLQQAAMSQQGQEVDQDQLKQDVVNMLIDNRLLVQASADVEATDEDIDATLSDIAAQFGLSSPEEVISTFGEQGMSEEEVRDEAASQFRVNSYIASEADVPEPSEEELRELYDAVVGQMGEDAGEVPSFEDAREQLAQQAKQEKENAAVEKILTDLREDGDVTINL